MERSGIIALEEDEDEDEGEEEEEDGDVGIATRRLDQGTQSAVLCTTSRRD